MQLYDDLAQKVKTAPRFGVALQDVADLLLYCPDRHHDALALLGQRSDFPTTPDAAEALTIDIAEWLDMEQTAADRHDWEAVRTCYRNTIQFLRALSLLDLLPPLGFRRYARVARRILAQSEAPGCA